VPGKLVVPLFLDSKSRHEPVKEHEFNKRLGKSLPGVKYRDHGYELGFSITYDKTQSRGFKKLILDLQPWPGMSLSHEKVLVGLSSVATMNNVKILPMASSQSLKHIYSLKPNINMLTWLAGYDADGRWDPKLAQDAVQKYQLSAKKKKSIATQDFLESDSIITKANYVTISSEAFSIMPS
jgi:hypothetical protein